MQDKQYLALELTKIKCDKTNNNGIYGRENIMEDYRYFLESLTEVFEKVEKVEKLEKEVEALKEFIASKMEKQDHGATKLHRLIDVINQCKGDMEPYVYGCLMAEIQSKIQ
jgi:hypothetical protein